MLIILLFRLRKRFLILFSRIKLEVVLFGEFFVIINHRFMINFLNFDWAFIIRTFSEFLGRPLRTIMRFSLLLLIIYRCLNRFSCLFRMLILAMYFSLRRDSNLSLTILLSLWGRNR